MYRFGVFAALLATAAAPCSALAESADGDLPTSSAVDQKTPPAVAPSGRVAADDESPHPPPAPPAVDRPPMAALSFIVRVPSGPGVDFSLYPIERAELGVSFSSWLLISEASAYARFAIVHHAGQSLTLGARLHGLVAAIGDDEGDPTHRLVSAELGYALRSGSFLFGVELGKAAWTNGAWTALERGGFTGEVRLGHVW